MRILEVPVDWVNDPYSRGDIVAPLRRCRGGVDAWPIWPCPGVLRTDLGVQRANLVALLLTALANTAVNRRITFGAADRSGVEWPTDGAERP
ncbi:MAG: hypothetical protein ABJA87_01275 [bacterium]